MRKLSTVDQQMVIISQVVLTKNTSAGQLQMNSDKNKS